MYVILLCAAFAVGVNLGAVIMALTSANKEDKQWTLEKTQDIS